MGRRSKTALLIVKLANPPVYTYTKQKPLYAVVFHFKCQKQFCGSQCAPLLGRRVQMALWVLKVANAWTRGGRKCTFGENAVARKSFRGLSGGPVPHPGGAEVILGKLCLRQCVFTQPCVCEWVCARSPAPRIDGLTLSKWPALIRPISWALHPDSAVSPFIHLYKREMTERWRGRGVEGGGAAGWIRGAKTERVHVQESA